MVTCNIFLKCNFSTEVQELIKFNSIYATLYIASERFTTLYSLVEKQQFLKVQR